MGPIRLRGRAKLFSSWISAGGETVSELLQVREQVNPDLLPLLYLPCKKTSVRLHAITNDNVPCQG
jgi:hypothetical protein